MFYQNRWNASRADEAAQRVFKAGLPSDIVSYRLSIWTACFLSLLDWNRVFFQQQESGNDGIDGHAQVYLEKMHQAQGRRHDVVGKEQFQRNKKCKR